VSAHVSSWAWKQRVGDDGAKLVLLKLADNANDEGVAWPSRATLLAECEVSEDTVKRRLRKLRELELVIVVPWFTPAGRQTSSMYVLPLNGKPAGLELGELLAKAEREGSAGELITFPGRGAAVPPSPAVLPSGGAPAPPSGGAPAPPTKEDPSEDPSEDRKDGDAATRRREPDLVWDTLTALFGEVGTGRSNARSKRNAAVRDLKGFDATPDTIRAAVRVWAKVMPAGTTMTDSALATHYPQLALEAGVGAGAKQRLTPCEECGVGGGHTADCPRAQAA
jgi:hypothetical protein